MVRSDLLQKALSSKSERTISEHCQMLTRPLPLSAGKLRCGDRLLAVDGHTLEGVRHAEAVSLLKQARQKVKLQIVSWMGTEL